MQYIHHLNVHLTKPPKVRVHIEHLASLITGYLSHNLLVMTSIAQLIKTSEYVCTGRYPVQASAVFLNELIISLSLSLLSQGEGVK